MGEEGKGKSSSVLSEGGRGREFYTRYYEGKKKNRSTKSIPFFDEKKEREVGMFPVSSFTPGKGKEDSRAEWEDVLF